MKMEWTLQVKHNPIQGWKQRAEHFRSEKNYANALQNFDALKRNIQYLKGLVSDAAGARGGYIDMQIEEAKERRTFSR